MNLRGYFYTTLQRNPILTRFLSFLWQVKQGCSGNFGRTALVCVRPLMKTDQTLLLWQTTICHHSVPGNWLVVKLMKSVKSILIGVVKFALCRSAGTMMCCLPAEIFLEWSKLLIDRIALKKLRCALPQSPICLEHHMTVHGNWQTRPENPEFRPVFLL